MKRLLDWLKFDPYETVREDESWTLRPCKPTPEVNVSGLGVVACCAVVIVLKGCYS